jgi:hypothetical protein
VTLVVSANADGSNKIPCMMIGKLKLMHVLLVEPGKFLIATRKKHGWINPSVKYVLISYLIPLKESIQTNLFFSF